MAILGCINGHIGEVQTVPPYNQKLQSLERAVKVSASLGTSFWEHCGQLGPNQVFFCYACSHATFNGHTIGILIYMAIFGGLTLRPGFQKHVPDVRDVAQPNYPQLSEFCWLFGCFDDVSCSLGTKIELLVVSLRLLEILYFLERSRDSSRSKQPTR